MQEWAWENSAWKFGAWKFGSWGGQGGRRIEDEEFYKDRMTYDEFMFRLKQDDERLVGLLLTIVRSGILNQWR